MKTITAPRPMPEPRRFDGSLDPRPWLREAFFRQRLLTGFAVLLWLAMVPGKRSIRDVVPDAMTHR